MSGALVPRPPDPLDRAGFAARIVAAWRESTLAIIETGRLIAAAKAALAHGEFLELVNADLPFGARTAQRLMAIAADPRLTNATHVSHLPASWGTLYELTKLDDATFGEKLADGTIRPDMQRRDIAQTQKVVARAVKEELLGRKIAALPEKRYGVILADPPWRFEPWSRESGMDRAADNHYPTMPLADIMALNVRDIAAPDCALFLWATVPMLAEAFCLLDAWGFASFARDPESGFLMPDRREARYVSNAVWAKYAENGIGMGHWFRVDHEILLVATRGAVPCPAKGDQYRSILGEPASRVHSAKPDAVAELIEDYFPSLPKIELFARAARPNWDSWGLEAPPSQEVEERIASGEVANRESIGEEESRAKAGDEATAGPSEPAPGATEERPVQTAEAEPVSRPVGGRTPATTSENGRDSRERPAPNAACEQAPGEGSPSDSPTADRRLSDEDWEALEIPAFLKRMRSLSRSSPDGEGHPPPQGGREEEEAA